MSEQTFDDVLGDIPKEAPRAALYDAFDKWMNDGAKAGYDDEESLTLMIGHFNESDQLRPLIPLFQLWFERRKQRA